MFRYQVDMTFTQNIHFKNIKPVEKCNNIIKGAAD